VFEGPAPGIPFDTEAFDPDADARERWPDFRRRPLRERPLSPDDDLVEDPNQPTTRRWRRCSPLPACLDEQLLESPVPPGVLLFENGMFRALTPVPDNGVFLHHVVLVDAQRGVLDDLHEGPGIGLEVRIDGPRVVICRVSEFLAHSRCVVGDFARGEVVFDGAKVESLATGRLSFAVDLDALPSWCAGGPAPTASRRLGDDAALTVMGSVDVSRALTRHLGELRFGAHDFDRAGPCERWPDAFNPPSPATTPGPTGESGE
jgi:hypothetical protein